MIISKDNPARIGFGTRPDLRCARIKASALKEPNVRAQRAALGSGLLSRGWQP